MSKGPATGSTPAQLDDGITALAGRRIVLARLGLDAEELIRRHPEPGELRTLTTLISREAERLDDLDHELRRTAAGAIDRLGRIRAGDHRDVQRHGILRVLGSDLETLGAQFDLATAHLGQAIGMYREAADRAAPQPERAHGRAAAANKRTTATELHTPVVLPTSADQAPPATSTPVRHR